MAEGLEHIFPYFDGHGGFTGMHKFHAFIYM
jgi:hypothetical protein